MSTGRRILRWLGPYRVHVAIALGLTSLACVLNVPVPLLVQGVVDHVAAGKGGWNLPVYAVSLFCVFAAQAGFGWLNSLLVGRVGQNVVRDLRHQLYERLQRLGLAYYDKTPTGAIVSRLMDDVGAIQAFITSQTVTILTDLGTALVISVLLLVQNVRLAVVVLLFLGLYAINFRVLVRKIRANTMIIRAKMDALFGHLNEKIEGSLVIRSYAQEPAEEKEFSRKLADVHVPRVAESYLSATLSNVSAGISGIGTAAVFAVAAWEVLSGRMSVGGVVSTAALAALMFGPVARLADLAYVFEQAAASVDRLGEILDLSPGVLEPSPPLAIGRARGEVEFDRVSFGYEARSPVVWDIRLRIRPGMKVALVGPTGCGKSTLVNLLLRFYDPTHGAIRLDGVPICRLASTELRRQVGVVLQDPVIFRQSVADNIRYGAPHATDEHVEAAARAALVHGFASSLPDGYGTIIGSGGHKLSQGERQRIAIARVLCADPALVVMDEATSSLDTGSETLIQAALGNLLCGRTSFIIAHRLSTIIDADLIVVMDGGLIVQMGTHDELILDEPGLYRQLCLRQFGETQVASAADRRQHLPAPHFHTAQASRLRNSA